MDSLLAFILTTLGIAVERKNLLDGRGLFGSNVFKNPAKYKKYNSGLFPQCVRSIIVLLCGSLRKYTFRKTKSVQIRLYMYCM